MNKTELLNKIYEECGCNVADLLIDFETRNPKVQLKYKNVYLNDRNEILVDVLDEVSECFFTLILVGDELEVYDD